MIFEQLPLALRKSNSQWRIQDAQMCLPVKEPSFFFDSSYNTQVATLFMITGQSASTAGVPRKKKESQY